MAAAPKLTSTRQPERRSAGPTPRPIAAFGRRIAMPSQDSNHRRRRPPIRVIVEAAAYLGSLLIVAAWCTSAAHGQVQIFGRPNADEKETTSGVYLPTDRALSRAMARARERLEEKEYHQALTFL